MSSLSSAALSCSREGTRTGKPQPTAPYDAGPRESGTLDATPVPDGSPSLVDAGAPTPRDQPPYPTASSPCELSRGADGLDAGGEQVPAVTTGSYLGAFRDRAMRFWVRSDAEAEACIEYWPLQAPERRVTAATTALEAERDFTGTATAADLMPGTRYGYRLWIAAPNGPFSLTDREGVFQTPPAEGQPARVRLIVGADIAGTSSQPIFDQIREHRPDTVLLIGDLAYTDGLEPLLSVYRTKYRRNWSIAELARLGAEFPILAMWDDHDIMDNYWQGRDPVYEVARVAFDEYVGSRLPSAGGESLYFDFTLGEIGVFVLDVRSYRSPNAEPDGPMKTMLGEQQLSDLLSWLTHSPAAVKIIASPVMFSDYATTGDDAWRSFKAEREAIFEAIVDRGIDDVLLVSGDQHWSAVFRLVRGEYELYEFQATPLSKSPRRPPTLSSGETLTTFGGAFVYGVIDIDTTVRPATVDLTLCVEGRACDPGSEPEPSAGSAPFTVHLTTDDLGVPQDRR